MKMWEKSGVNLNNQPIKDPVSMMHDYAGDLLINHVRDTFTIDKEYDSKMRNVSKTSMSAHNFKVSGSTNIPVVEDF